MRVAVVVLGDIGHSPRMQYHTMSLINKGISVDLIGYTKSEPRKEILNSELVKIHAIKDFISFPRFLFMIYAPLKFIFLLLQLFYVLYFSISSQLDAILVQNPPAIPLFVSYIVCKFRRNCYLFIDWHNFGYSILQITQKNFLPKLYKWYEQTYGRKSFHNFCVTKSMKRELQQDPWKIKSSQITVLYDRPPSFFKKLDIQEKHKLFKSLKNEKILYSSENGNFLFQTTEDETAFTFLSKSNNKIQEKKNREGIIVSSTSWTKDEDFGILLEALQNYENIATKKHANLCVIITGDGPLRLFYQDKISKLNLKKVSIFCMWLKISNYPKLLGSADLGVSLHYSSSGVDLPMKVVDMFGCNLPVAAIQFPAITELVTDNKNGLLFQTSQQLSEQFLDLFENFENDKKKLNFLSSNAKFDQNWDQNWDEVVWPQFNKLIPKKKKPIPSKKSD